MIVATQPAGIAPIVNVTALLAEPSVIGVAHDPTDELVTDPRFNVSTAGNESVNTASYATLDVMADELVIVAVYVTTPPASAGLGSVAIFFRNVICGSTTVFVTLFEVAITPLPVLKFAALTNVLPARLLAVLVTTDWNNKRKDWRVGSLSTGTVIGVAKAKTTFEPTPFAVIAGKVPEKFVVSLIAEPGMNARFAGRVSVTTSEGVVPFGNVIASEYVTTSPIVR